MPSATCLKRGKQRLGSRSSSSIGSLGDQLFPAGSVFNLRSFQTEALLGVFVNEAVVLSNACAIPLLIINIVQKSEVLLKERRLIELKNVFLEEQLFIASFACMPQQPHANKIQAFEKVVNLRLQLRTKEIF